MKFVVKYSKGAGVRGMRDSSSLLTDPRLRNVPVQPQPKPARLGTFGLILLGVSLGSAVLTFHAWQQVRVVQLGFRIQELAHEREELLKQRQQLLLEMASLYSYDEIEYRARQQLGLADPAPGAIRFWDPVEVSE